MKRICLFAAYNKNGEVADYALYYVKALARLADVYYLADCPMKPEELAKLAPYTRGAWGYRHEKYDFGSWQELAAQIGPDKLAEYDECIFCNDSCYGPLFPLEPLFDAATPDPDTDAWALQYFGSYFWVLKNKAFTSEAFTRFLAGVKKQPSNEDVIHQYEDPLPVLLKNGGFKSKVFLHIPQDLNNCWKTYIRRHYPVLKIKVFTQPEKYRQREYLPGWRHFLRKHTDYDPTLIERHLRSLGLDPDYFDSFGFRLKSVGWALARCFKRLFRVHFCKRRRLIILFGITFLNRPRPAAIPELDVPPVG